MYYFIHLFGHFTREPFTNEKFYITQESSPLNESFLWPKNWPETDKKSDKENVFRKLNNDKKFIMIDYHNDTIGTEPLVNSHDGFIMSL